MSDEKRKNTGGDKPLRRRGGAGPKAPEKPVRARPGAPGKKATPEKPRLKKARAERPAPPERTSAYEGERISKVMARAGACSRRDAEQWIAEGRIAVNGRVLTSPAVNIREGDKITVDGKPLAERERTRLFLFHKPAGLVTSAKDPEGRETVFHYLEERHPDLPRLVSVGRLDINTEGLLLLTNDGGLARTLELPATGWTRRYRVRAHGDIDQARLDALREGVTVEGVDYAPIEARLDRVQGANAWITMSLTEGKNREIKRVLEHLGLAVTRLIRVAYGPFQLGELAEGAVEEVRLKVLRDQLGKGLAELAGVDFASPLREAPSATEEQQRREALQKRSRKHVSTLRKERAEERPRARIERAVTADRKGRAVAVERVIVKREKPEAEGRNARRFASLRRDAEPARGQRDAEARPARAPREGAKRFAEGRPREERAPRGERSFDREARPARAPREGAKRFGEGRPPREERAPRGERSFDREARPARAPREGAKRFGEGRPPREERAPRGPRAEGGGKAGPRGGAKSGGRSFDAGKPPRGGGRGPGGDKPRGGKPPRKPRA